MKKIELLAPVGSRDCVQAAIVNQADALYLGSVNFGARAFADAFSLEELQEIIEEAHVNQVKVYITLNTLLYDDEFDVCMNLVANFYQMRVDALIVQDLGLIYEIRNQYPDFELHASTQCHIYNLDTLAFYSNQGITRAVLAREVSLSMIKKMKQIPIELEVFVHGALCVSYSGQCLYSSVLNQRSGNRGMCAQGCRTSFQLYMENKQISENAYLLSPKDLNLLNYVPNLIDLGVDSLKIEGRMKSPQYVAHTTKRYAMALQHAIPKRESDEKTSNVLYSRGHTNGFIEGETPKHFINTKQPNHIGIPLGEVIALNHKYMSIKLCEALNQGDGIRFEIDPEVGFVLNWMYQNDLLIRHADKGEVVQLQKVKGVKLHTMLRKTKDVMLEKSISDHFLNQKKEIKINAIVEAHIGKPLKLTLMDFFGHQATCFSEQCIQSAHSQALSPENLKKQLSKTNQSVYRIVSYSITLDEQCFLSIKEINELRRLTLSSLNQCVLDSFQRKHKSFELCETKQTKVQEVFSVSVLNEEQLVACLDHSFTSIFVEDSALFDRYKDNKKIKRKASNVYYGNYNQVDLVGDSAGIGYKKALDYSLNIQNHHALRYVTKLGATSTCLSQELSAKQCIELAKNYKHAYKETCNTEVIVYGKTKLMSQAYCAIQEQFKTNQASCSLCKQKKFYLKNKGGQSLYLKGDDGCTMHMYNETPKNIQKSIPELRKVGIQMFRIQFCDEDTYEVHKISSDFFLIKGANKWAMETNKYKIKGEC